MEEKNIIVGEKKVDMQMRCIVITVIWVGAMLIFATITLGKIAQNQNYWANLDMSKYVGYVGQSVYEERVRVAKNLSFVEYVFHSLSDETIAIYIATFFLPIIIWWICWAIWGKYELVVTTRRIYGVTTFGKKVDIPLEAVSSVGTGVMSSVVIGTSSGKTFFGLIKNKDEVHKVLRNLIMNHQNNDSSKQISPPKVAQSGADELLKYKELLDMGAITQDEFDAKKKQLLGL